MADKTLKEVIPEITEEQVEALKGAGITAPEGLAGMNVEVIASRSQIPAQTLATWKLKAEQALGSPTPRAAAPAKKRGFWTARRVGWLLLALLWVVGVFLIWLSQNRLTAASELKTKIQSPLMDWVRFGAKEAVEKANDARVPIKNENFGEAREALGKAQELVALMRDTAPRKKGEIRKAERLLSEASEKLPKDPEAALRLLDDFAVAMGQVRNLEK
jgi:hypothetical protein